MFTAVWREFLQVNMISLDVTIVFTVVLVRVACHVISLPVSFSKCGRTFSKIDLEYK